MGGSTALYPCSFRCSLRELFPDASRLGSPRRCVRKDEDTSDTAALTVPWRSFCLHVAPNWFIRTDAENDDTSIFLCTCGILSSNLFLVPVCVVNVHHIYQLPDLLVAVALAIPLVLSRMLLVKISRR